MKGALFDLDGVITDTAIYHFAAWCHLVKKHFNAELPDELEEKTKGVSREDSLQIILDYLDIKVSKEEFAALAAEKNQLYVHTLENLSQNDILPGISKLLIDLKQHNIKIALASASKNGPFILKKLGLTDFFDAIVDPAKITSGKPAPDIFLAAAFALAISPYDCVGIEDSVAGIKAINSAGSVSIGVGGDELNHADKRFNNTADLNYQDIRKAWETYNHN
ncbi:beta-phosphoglucomutase [Streptococcus gallolyticus]|uniref:beta-phosphoglucomutase n=1 Tax=Streptococcus gallolyticus TaxID=315405 RepID=UPI00211BF272|nr:beta-phosphoglucomutase [Streptococcus gallolyticus]MCQ9215352.1 beta-phosphoglucomutase [Streptococcus gallolyticus]